MSGQSVGLLYHPPGKAAVDHVQLLKREKRKLEQPLAQAQRRIGEMTGLAHFRKNVMQHFRVPDDAPRALRLGLKLARFLRKCGL